MKDGSTDRGTTNTIAPDTFVTIDVHKESLHFSCAHFTIFGQSERENLHGHNFFVRASATGPIGDDGLCFDYTELKDALASLCDQLDETTLLPEGSPYLEFEKSDQYVTVFFGNERLVFLKRDILLLPLRNITVEELARWFLEKLHETELLKRSSIHKLELTLSSGPSQSASISWTKP
ncbi:MAG: 6-carboxytetrahydropterin synthase [Gammaproteobacteria bacterium]|nr:6-carboxytetrahydropterin synthase [Gammaproteobacteria bacterium]